MATVCNMPGCPNISVRKGRCPVHQRPAWEGRRGFKGYKGEWFKIRALVLKEEPTCRECGAPSTTVDHILAKAFGGSDSRENLRALCNDCRRLKDAQDAARGRSKI